jgi:C1A family cysteine protease
VTEKLRARTNARYGWKPDLPDHRDEVVNYGLEQVRALPSSVDLRPKMPPVYDQGQLGSCTANAIGAALEFHELTQVMPSRLFIYYNERFMEGDVDQDAGAQIRDGIKSVSLVGVCPESEWPYEPAQFATKPPEKCYTDALQAVAVKYARVQPTQFQIKAALAGGHPVVIGFTVYESFEGPEVASTGEMALPQPNEGKLGGHAVLVVGYDDAKGRWIVRNSWGTGWGDGGYFYMPYAYLTTPGLASDFWQIQAVGKH